MLRRALSVRPAHDDYMGEPKTGAVAPGQSIFRTRGIGKGRAVEPCCKLPNWMAVALLAGGFGFRQDRHSDQFDATFYRNLSDAKSKNPHINRFIYLYSF